MQEGGGSLYHILVEFTCLISVKSDGWWWVMMEHRKPYQGVFPPTAARLGVLSWLEQVTLLLVFGKWKWKSLNCKVAHSLWPRGLYSPWNSPGQNTGVGSCFLLQGIFPTQGSNPGFPHCGQILYQLSLQGKPKNTGVGSLSLVQWIFPTQESDWGLLHCRWVLYQLNYQGSPKQLLIDKCILLNSHQ